jgi:hypothetical protein
MTTFLLSGYAIAAPRRRPEIEIFGQLAVIRKLSEAVGEASARNHRYRHSQIVAV